MISLRDYQSEAVSALCTSRRGIVQAPAGSGKTVIAAAALNRWAPARARMSGVIVPVAWFAHTVEQCQQAEVALSEFPKLSKYADVHIACYQSGVGCIGYRLAVLDECHHVAAPSFRKLLDFHEGWRWGLSATPDRADDLAADVYDLVGPVVCRVGRQALVDDGRLACARVIIHQPNSKGEFTKEIMALAIPEFTKRVKRYGRYMDCTREQMKNRCIWQFCNDLGINRNEDRNRRIVEIAGRHSEDSTLIIIGKIEHGEELAKGIPGSVCVYSKMGAKKRREALEGFRSGDIRCIIATSLADEGLDVPRANVLILAAAGRSAAKAEQRTGRVLRTFAGKTHGTIHDFMDVQHCFLNAQSRKRIQIYQSLGYDISFADQPELEGIS